MTIRRGIVLVSTLLFAKTSSFSVEPAVKWQRALGVNPRHAETIDGGGTTDVTGGNPSSWVDLLDPVLRSDMEQELVAKYMQTGLSADEARTKTEIFLSDNDQAEKYFEMRMYTEANTQSLPMTILQLLGGFVVGFAAIVGPKLMNH